MQANFNDNIPKKPIKKQPFLKKNSRPMLSSALQASSEARKQKILQENQAYAKQESNEEALKIFQPHKNKIINEQQQIQVNFQYKEKENKMQNTNQLSAEKQSLKQFSQKSTIVKNNAQNQSQQQNNNEVLQSKLVQKLFHKDQKKEEKKNEEKQKQKLMKEQEIVKQFVQKKIENLNTEINNFKTLNEQLNALKRKHEDQEKQIQKQEEEIQTQKQNDRDQFEIWRKNEMSKIKKDKKQLEQSTQVLASQPNRKERQQIDELKQQYESLKEQQQKKDQKNKLNYERLKKDLDKSLQLKQELENELSQFDQIKMIQQTPKQQKTINNRTKPQQNQTLSLKKYEQQQKQIIQDSQQQTIINTLENNNQIEQDNWIISRIFVQNNCKKLTIKNLDKEFSLNNFDYSDNQFYKKYLSAKSSFKNYKIIFVLDTEKITIISKTSLQNGSKQIVYDNNKKEILQQNGVKKEIFSSGYSIIHFANQDIKQFLPNGIMVYYFQDKGITQITIPNGGPTIYKFNNSQLEIHQPNGHKEIMFKLFCFPGGTSKFLNSRGEEIAQIG